MNLDNIVAHVYYVTWHTNSGDHAMLYVSDKDLPEYRKKYFDEQHRKYTHYIKPAGQKEIEAIKHTKELHEKKW